MRGTIDCEASVRWKKGLACVLLLGGAYGIVEEAFAAKTMTDPNQPFMGILGVYGHWLGINWVPTAAFLLFHSVFSISFQILLVQLIFPHTNGQGF
jgi:hypothetical protein